LDGRIRDVPMLATCTRTPALSDDEIRLPKLDLGGSGLRQHRDRDRRGLNSPTLLVFRDPLDLVAPSFVRKYRQSFLASNAETVESRAVFYKLDVKVRGTCNDEPQGSRNQRLGTCYPIHPRQHALRESGFPWPIGNTAAGVLQLP